MKIITLPPQTRNNLHATHKAIISFSDLTSTGSAQTIQIFPTGTGTFAAGTTVRFGGMNLVSAFSGGGLSALVLQVGDGNSVGRIMAGKELCSAGTEILYWVEAATTQPYAYPIADGLDAKFSAAGVTGLTSITKGAVEIYFEISDLDTLERAQ